jgi:drug/metabolite transporter (DMT)-like permease
VTGEAARIEGRSEPPSIPDGGFPRPPRKVIYLALVVLFVVWSNAFHAIAYFRRDLGVSASGLIMLRFGPVTLFCLAWCLWRWRACRELFARHGWRVIAMALCMIPAYNLALNWGQLRVSPATASLLVSLNPVFTLILAIACLGEKPGVRKLAGMALAFLGVYLLVRAQHASFGSTYLPYALVVLLAPLSWAIATVTGKAISHRADPLLLTFAATGLGSLPFLVALIAGLEGTHETLSALTGIGWAALAHLTILCTIAGFAVWFWALRLLPASTVAAFVFLNPPLTALFGMVWRTEPFQWSVAVFGSVTLAGVALSTISWRRGRR